MRVSKEEIISILSQFNPWWRRDGISDLPPWRRAAFNELFDWLKDPPAHRAVMLSGARQIGKTTLMLQCIDKLLDEGVRAANILYVTFDHPLLKLAGIDAVLEVWRSLEPRVDGYEYIFLDEAQFIRDWGTWIKHQVDFFKFRRIAFTGSAMPLVELDQESGVGRWHTIKLTTMSFYEYLQLKKLSLPSLPKVKSLRDIFEWPEHEFYRVSEAAAEYVGHFHDYLLRGGFPQTALVDSVQQAQKLLREDIIDKVLKRDMTALFGVRKVLDLEHTFLYLCMNDGGLLDMQNLRENLEIKRPTAESYIDLLEATHLIYKLQPFGYGKDILRAKYKIYIADAAIAPAVLLRGKALLENAEELGQATETAVFKHLFARYYAQSVKFSYWRGKKDLEVDLVAEVMGQVIPFEVKYRSTHTEMKDLKGLKDFCKQKKIDRAYVVTKLIGDFGVVTIDNSDGDTRILKIPAQLLCYWMGEAELKQ